MSDSEYGVSEEIALENGDLLVMATDGLQEALSREGELYGTDRMLKVILRNRDQQPADLIEALVADLNDYVDHRPLHDDITLVVARADFES